MGQKQDQVAPEAVIRRAVTAKVVIKAEDLLKEVSPELANNETQVLELTKLLMTDHGLSKKEIIEELKAELLEEDSDDDDIENELADKITKNQPPNQPKRKNEQDDLDMFDDY